MIYRCKQDVMHEHGAFKVGTLVYVEKVRSDISNCTALRLADLSSLCIAMMDRKMSEFSLDFVQSEFMFYSEENFLLDFEEAVDDIQLWNDYRALDKDDSGKAVVGGLGVFCIVSILCSALLVGVSALWAELFALFALGLALMTHVYCKYASFKRFRNRKPFFEKYASVKLNDQ